MPEEKQAVKPTNKERLKQITDSIEAGIKELFASDKYKKYLAVMSRFHNYSFNNTMLIYMQNPKATRVASYTKWKDSFGRQVKKGERGITIIAPTPYKKKIEEVKKDPDTKLPLLDKNGNEITEEKTITIPFFKPVFVFDVAQTEGRPLPQLVSNLTGNVEHYEAFLEAMKRSAPVPVIIEPMKEGMDGYYSPGDREIHIREGMSEAQTICALVHETTHALLHNDGMAKPDAAKDAREEEKYAHADILGVDALYSDQWISPDKVPEGMYRYSLRGGRNDDPGLPCSVENGVTVNFAGCLLTMEPLPIPESGALEFGEDDFGFQGEEITVAEFRRENHKDRRTQEVEAESVSYSVCQYYGIETSENSFGYIAEWSKSHELTELKASLETINRTAGKLIGDIDRNFAEICQDRGIVIMEQPEGGEPNEPAKPVESKEAEKPGNTYSIYRLKDDPSTAELRFTDLESLEGKPDKRNYEAVYTGNLPDNLDLSDRSVRERVLEAIFERFNQEERPRGYEGPSMSVSDIVALKQGDVVSYHYCDSFGFKDLPDFGKQEHKAVRLEHAAKKQPSVLDAIRAMEKVPKQTQRVKEAKKNANIR